MKKSLLSLIILNLFSQLSFAKDSNNMEINATVDSWCKISAEGFNLGEITYYKYHNDSYKFYNSTINLFCPINTKVKLSATHQFPNGSANGKIVLNGDDNNLLNKDAYFLYSLVTPNISKLLDPKSSVVINVNSSNWLAQNHFVNISFKKTEEIILQPSLRLDTSYTFTHISGDYSSQSSYHIEF